jgi:hypothetical protein
MEFELKFNLIKLAKEYKMKKWICIVFILFFNCSEDPYYEWIKRSARTDIDIYLIPEKYNILEAKWIKANYTSHFDKMELIEHLKSYGRSIEDIKSIPNINYKEENGIISLEVGKTSHSTAYHYDLNIPISFYGSKWFKNGNYSEVIHQQHIVPTLSKILNIRNPNGVVVKPVSNILQTGYEKEKPEIILTVVIDQGGMQLFKAHPKVPNFIQSIQAKSAYFPNAMVGHIDAHTAVGHAAIGTGSYPKESKVIGNSFFKVKDGKFHKSEIYATDEKLVNPSELLTETLADVLDFEEKNNSEIISQCYALRASIGMAGHGSANIPNQSYIGDKDHVYWLNASEVNWVTDNRYYTLPAYINQFNSFDYFKKYHPNGWSGLKVNSKADITKAWGIVMASPSEVKMETDSFLNTIQTEIINKNKHKDHVTDLAYITLKATDAVGHQFGWESLEAKETFKEVDLAIKNIFNFLEKNYSNNFILIITADHGCAPLPEISGGNRYTTEELIYEVDTLLPKGSNKSIIQFMSVAQIALDKNVMKEYGISEKQVIDKIKGIKVNNKYFFKKVLSRQDVL